MLTVAGPVLAGFLLTFILHTTHAAKNGSRAGLGITLIQLGVRHYKTDSLSCQHADSAGLRSST